MKQMMTLKWLLKREIWENKAMLIWSNLALAGLILIFTLSGIFRLKDAAIKVDLQADVQLNDLVTAVGHYFTSGLILFSILMVFAVYSYATGSLSDERKDRSILFWKSLPVSDELTVFSKVIVALILFPLMGMLTLVLTNLISMFALCGAYAAHGVGLFSFVFSSNGIWGQVGHTLKSFPIYVAWALPTIGWMILVSSWVKSRPGMWAILIPVGVFACIAFANDVVGVKFVRDVAYALLFRGVFSIVPDSWSYHYYLTEYEQTLSLPASIQNVVLKADLSSWDIFATSDLWIGVIVGIGMLFMAARIRRGRGD
ncbi:hypothetical protein ACO0KY_13875 [Undibacterium sp. Dicai25W]|uniref:hypothetical protein n=1 Tax=Undibacterium sp. Dicai25W TaxID=3413034 RepID=UPI003BF165CB